MIESLSTRTTVAIKSRIGIPAAQKLLRKAIYAVMIGINDVQIMEIAAFALSQDAYLDQLISTLRLELELKFPQDF